MASRRRRRRRWLILGGGCALVIAIGVYFTLTGLSARAALVRARAELRAVKADIVAGESSQANRDLARAASNAAAAERDTAGPLWWAAAQLPWAGGPFESVRGVAAIATDVLRQVLPGVVTSVSRLTEGDVHVAHGQINLSAFTQTSAVLIAADRRMHAIVAGLGQLPRHTWLSSADTGRGLVARLLLDLGGQLHDAASAAQLVPAMLGGQRTHTYMIVFENDAESRGLGGLPAQFAILRVVHGQLSFTSFGNDTEVSANVNVPLGVDFASRYTQYGAESSMENTDMSPNFPFAAQLWAAMWQRRTGQRLDGAVATDPTALSYLLGVVGPARLADGTAISATNVVAAMESGVYGQFPDRQVRRRFFIAVAKAAASTVIDNASGHVRQLIHAMARAVGERRLLVWSADPTEERTLASLPIGGLLPHPGGNFISLAVNNAAGTKLDYYLDRTLVYSPGGCRAGRRSVLVKVILHNDAPSHGLAPYVVIRADRHAYPVTPGSNREFVSLYASSGAQFDGLTVDGKVGEATVEHELGFLVLTVDIELSPGQARTLIFGLDEPRRAGPVETIVQPLVRPLKQLVLPAVC